MCRRPTARDPHALLERSFRALPIGQLAVRLDQVDQYADFGPGSSANRPSSLQ